MAHSWKEGFGKEYHWPKTDMEGDFIYPGQERDDGWVQRIEQSRKAYEAQVQQARKVAGLPPLQDTLVPPKVNLTRSKLSYALEVIEKVLQEGELKYPDNKWRRQGWWEHVSHAMTHIFQLQGGVTGENHLAHAACRLLMAIEKRHE